MTGGSRRPTLYPRSTSPDRSQPNPEHCPHLSKVSTNPNQAQTSKPERPISSKPRRTPHLGRISVGPSTRRFPATPTTERWPPAMTLSVSKPERGSGDGGARPPRAQWTAPSRSIGGARNDSPPGGSGRVRIRCGARRTAAEAAAIPIHFHCIVPCPRDRKYLISKPQRAA